MKGFLILASILVFVSIFGGYMTDNAHAQTFYPLIAKNIDGVDISTVFIGKPIIIQHTIINDVVSDIDVNVTFSTYTTNLTTLMKSSEGSVQAGIQSLSVELEYKLTVFFCIVIVFSKC